MIDLTKATAERKKSVLESIANGSSVTAAAEAAGCRRETVYYWIHHDEDFAAACKEARAGMVSSVWGEAYRLTQTEEYITTEEQMQRGEDGQLMRASMKRTTKRRWPSVAAIELFLRNHDPNFIERNQVDATPDLDELRDSLKAERDLGD